MLGRGYRSGTVTCNRWKEYRLAMKWRQSYLCQRNSNTVNPCATWVSVGYRNRWRWRRHGEDEGSFPVILFVVSESYDDEMNTRWLWIETGLDDVRTVISFLCLQDALQPAPLLLYLDEYNPYWMNPCFFSFFLFLILLFSLGLGPMSSVNTLVSLNLHMLLHSCFHVVIFTLFPPPDLTKLAHLFPHPDF